MANEIKVSVQSREALGRHAKKLRAQGLIPANISGGGKPSTAIQLDPHELHDILKAHGTPILRITVEPGGDTDTALLARVERDAVSAAVLHVDFRRCRANPADQGARTFAYRGRRARRQAL